MSHILLYLNVLVAARTASKNITVAYLPVSSNVTLKAKWFDPFTRKAMFYQVPIVFLLASIYSFSHPFIVSIKQQIPISTTRQSSANADVKKYTKMILNNSKSSQAYLLLGVTYGKIGNYHKAEALIKKSLLLKPSEPEAHHDLATVYRLQTHYFLAIKEYKQAIHLNPSYENAYLNLGYTYLLVDDPNKALIAFKRSIILNPKEDRSYFNLGLIYEKQRKWQEAQYYYRNAFRLKPNDKMYLQALIKAHGKEKEL